MSAHCDIVHTSYIVQTYYCASTIDTNYCASTIDTNTNYWASTLDNCENYIKNYLLLMHRQ